MDADFCVHVVVASVDNDTIGGIQGSVQCVTSWRHGDAANELMISSKDIDAIAS